MVYRPNLIWIRIIMIVIGAYFTFIIFNSVNSLSKAGAQVNKNPGYTLTLTKKETLSKR